jgi:hypothetical protein
MSVVKKDCRWFADSTLLCSLFVAILRAFVPALSCTLRAPKAIASALVVSRSSKAWHQPQLKGQSIWFASLWTSVSLSSAEVTASCEGDCT